MLSLPFSCGAAGDCGDPGAVPLAICEANTLTIIDKFYIYILPMVSP